MGKMLICSVSNDQADQQRAKKNGVREAAAAHPAVAILSTLASSRPPQRNSDASSFGLTYFYATAIRWRSAALDRMGGTKPRAASAGLSQTERKSYLSLSSESAAEEGRGEA